MPNALKLVGVEQEFVVRLTFLNISSPVVWVLLLLLLSFVLAMLWAPLLIGPLRTITRKKIDQKGRPILYSMHNGKQGTPSMGGLLFVVNTLVLCLFFLTKADYFWLTLLGIVTIGLVGVTDDYLVTWSTRFTGLRAWQKFGLQAIVALILAVNLYQRYGYSQLQIPLVGILSLGVWMVPLLILIMLASINAVNLTDGLDGLAAGVSLFAFSGYLVIALVQQQFHVATLIAVLMGSLLAFLWFNIYPARFFMGDVGALTLGLSLALMATLTGQLALLPIFGLVFVLETLSVILQVFWRKVFKRKLFTIAPYHHHLERLGWPETKVSQRFWMLGAVSMILGLLLYFAH